MTSEVRYETVGAVATITLDRTSALNALTVAVKLDLLAALRRAGDDPAVRAVVLTGAGRAFCVGQDLREHLDGLETGALDLPTVTEHYNPIVEAIATLPKPVIAAVNGTAAGAGAALAFACDLRIAASDAAFLMAFARVGLGPDSGASWTLQRLVGSGRAAAMLMLAEPVAAHQALEMGLVSVVVPAEDLLTTAAELAARLAAGPTVAYAAIKETLSFAASHSLVESLAKEAAAQARCGHTEDHRNAVDAFLAKQPATFTGR
ncbi:MAG TPA: enoyl-CoA hydratase-related protein [Mycobacteriales bacterium]|jgi:2-(1,2-epoxy-1,2-dihydrophenyl)acetyl-CoA isomerase|nr:enoyl-CoA hydratase-related protein [Mycobacteriales bacterium]